MDLANIKPIEKRYNLQNPANGEGTGMFLILACTHDERVKAAMRSVNDEILKGGKDLSQQEQQKLDDAIAAAYIVGVEYEGEVEWKGGQPEYSQALAKEICAIPALKEQVLYEVRRTRDFYQA